MKLLHKNIRLSIILILFGLLLFFEVLFLGILGPRFLELSQGTELLDMTTFYSPEQAYDMIDNYGPGGRAYYNHIQLADLFFPIVYSLLFISLIAFFLGKINKISSNWRYLLLAPVVGGVSDWLENLGIFSMLRIYPQQFDAIARMTNIACIVKFAGLSLSILSAVLVTIVYFCLKPKEN